MANDLTWGAQTLPRPSADGGIVVAAQGLGASRRTLDAALRLDLTGVKTNIRLSWRGLTKAELDVITAALTLYASTPTALTLPDGRAYTVLLNAGPRLTDTAEEWEGGVNPRYSATLELTEA